MNLQIVVDALTQIITDILTFIPHLINGLIILVVGYIIAYVARWILLIVLRRLQVDPMVERIGITGALRGLGVKIPLSSIMGQTVFALLLIAFLITATRLMELDAVASLLERLLTFLPNVIAALIIFMLGGMVAQFVGKLVTTVGITSGLNQAAQIGRVAQHLISLFVAVLVLAQLGIDTAILVSTITILLAAFGLAIALALGLGARSIVTHVLAGSYIRQRFPIGHPIVVEDVRGVIISVGRVNTVVLTITGSRVIVPNRMLFESRVSSPRRLPTPPVPPQMP